MDSTDSPSTSKRPLIIAHRGDSVHAPENTLAAFRAAHGACADGIEIDIQTTSDGHLVCMHDSELLRTTNASRRFPDRKSFSVRDFSLRDIQSLDAGAWYDDAFEGERVPSLEEGLCCILESSPHSVALVEVKESVLNSLIEMANAFARIVGAMESARVIVQSFYSEILHEMAQAAPDISRYQLVPPISSVIPGLFPTIESALDSVTGYTHGVSLAEQDADASLIGLIRERGLGLFVWTVNKPKRIRELALLGVDGIITDDPAMALGMLRQ